MLLKHYKTILLFLLIAFHIINIAFWLNSMELPEGKDTYSHLDNLSKLIKTLSPGHKVSLFYKDSRSLFHNLIFNFVYPPAYYYVGLLLKILFGWISPGIILFTSSVFFVLLIISVYKIGELIHRGTGLASAFILSFYPAIYQGARQFNLEIAITAMVTLCVYFLFKTQEFRHRGYALCLGMSLGIGMLIKYTLPVFIIGPLFFVFLRVFFGQKQRPAKELNNFLCCLLLAAAIALIYYHHWPSVAHFLGVAANTYRTSGQGLMQMMIYYLKHGIINYMRGFFVWFAVVSAVLLVGIRCKGKNIIYLWAVTPIFLIPIFLKLSQLITMMIYKMPAQPVRNYPLCASYILPALPAFALIGGIAVAKIRRKIIRYTVVIILVFVSITGYYTKTPSAGLSVDPQEQEIFKKTFRQLGNYRGKLGVVSLGSGDENIDMYTYVGAFLLVWSKNYPDILDFYVSPTLFLKELDAINIIIIASREVAWPDQAYFEENLREVCRQRQFDLVIQDEDEPVVFDGKKMRISRKAIARLVGIRPHFYLENVLTFYPKPYHYPVKFYIYKRKDLMQNMKIKSSNQTADR